MHCHFLTHSLLCHADFDTDCKNRLRKSLAEANLASKSQLLSQTLSLSFAASRSCNTCCFEKACEDVKVVVGDKAEAEVAEQKRETRRVERARQAAQRLITQRDQQLDSLRADSEQATQPSVVASLLVA